MLVVLKLKMSSCHLIVFQISSFCWWITYSAGKSMLVKYLLMITTEGEQKCILALLLLTQEQNVLCVCLCS